MTRSKEILELGAATLSTGESVFENKKNLISTVTNRMLKIQDIVKYMDDLKKHAELALNEEEVTALEKKSEKYWHLSAADKAFILSEITVNISAVALSAFSGGKFFVDAGISIAAGNTILDSATTVLAETCPFFAVATILVNAGAIFDEIREAKKMGIEFAEVGFYMNQFDKEIQGLIDDDKIPGYLINQLDDLKPNNVESIERDKLITRCLEVKRWYDNAGHLNYQAFLNHLAKKSLNELIQEQAYTNFHKIKDDKNTIVPLNLLYQQAIEQKIHSVQVTDPHHKDIAKQYVIAIQNLQNYQEANRAFGKIQNHKAARVGLLTMGIFAAASLAALSLTVGLAAAPVATAVLTIGMIALGVGTMLHKKNLTKKQTRLTKGFASTKQFFEDRCNNEPFFNLKSPSNDLTNGEASPLDDEDKELAINRIQSDIAVLEDMKHALSSESDIDELIQKLQQKLTKLSGKESEPAVPSLPENFSDTPLVLMTKQLVDAIKNYKSKFAKDILKIVHDSKLTKVDLEENLHIDKGNCIEILSLIQKASNNLQGKYQENGAFAKWGKFKQLFSQDPMIEVINNINADKPEEAVKIIKTFTDKQDLFEEKKKTFRDMRKKDSQVVKSPDEERKIVYEQFSLGNIS